jgi:hypothetical protein
LGGWFVHFHPLTGVLDPQPCAYGRVSLRNFGRDGVFVTHQDQFNIIKPAQGIQGSGRHHLCAIVTAYGVKGDGNGLLHGCRT